MLGCLSKHEQIKKTKNDGSQQVEVHDEEATAIYCKDNVLIIGIFF